MRKILGLFFVSVFIASCATAYQKNGFFSFTGGFSETQLGENIFKVVFQGNGYTSSERAENLCLLRCADLSLKNGFSYFVIISAQGDTSVSTYTTPTQSYTTGNTYSSGNNVYGSAQTTTYGGQTFIISKPSAKNTILCFKEKPEISGLFYEASFVAKSIRQKYNIKEEIGQN